MSIEPRKPANEPKKALGKGLHSLLPSRSTGPTPVTDPVAAGSVLKAPLEKIKPNPNQPRREFDQEALLELSQSIERDGIIQPIIVRRMPNGEFQIIAGERRWRAATIASLKEVPVIVRDADDQKVLELAIVENIQREDLNPIELALAFERMATELSLSHEEIGQKTGKDRATVTNSIRLLQLPDSIRDFVSAKKLSPGHARALLKIQNAGVQQSTAERCIAEGWSVRDIEKYTKSAPEPSDALIPVKAPKVQDPNVRAAITELERALGTKVRIMEKSGGKGSIEIEYYSDDDLDRLYTLIAGGH